jgi:hypothetical protein
MAVPDETDSREDIEALAPAKRNRLTRALSGCLKIDEKRRVTGRVQHLCSAEHCAPVRPNAREEQHGRGRTVSTG